ncbi:hypothetical protein CVIRNUC_001832 [Coccomyxa viridis]|uniref:Uncharacterized protein n=1 Tax=Coccomyxa viridis TaxID=1274662 RepID=A0AAV1HVL9_9CHLO|nr:hypothetical protein CVIRNUC_001832 [Coccomyxa viridis]
MEEQDKLEEILGPRDLAEGSTIIHNIMGGINKVLRIAVAGSGYGRARSLRLTADSVTKTVEAMQLSSGGNSNEVEEPYKRLIAELAAAQKLEARASQELLDVKPVNSLSPSLKAAAEASQAPDPTI